MLAIKARYDGRRIVLPSRRPKVRPGAVLVLFSAPGGKDAERRAWLKAQERSFAKIWDNDEDAVYDRL